MQPRQQAGGRGQNNQQWRGVAEPLSEVAHTLQQTRQTTMGEHVSITEQQRDWDLSQWIKPSSTSEQDRQARAERMVKDAIAAYTPLTGVSYSVYAKGSYPNNTNVRLDSDVDIVVECKEVFFYAFADGLTVPYSPPTPYTGTWTKELWREAVTRALIAKFGSGVDASHNVALFVDEVPNSRPSVDVVPSFGHRLYTASDASRYLDGSCVWTKDGSKIVNWPQQQLENGRSRNTATGGRYKEMVRALKSAENVLVADGVIKDLPSYFMECLVWNVPVTLYTSKTLSDAFLGVIAFITKALMDKTHLGWMEPNGIKPLWGPSQKWSDGDALLLMVGAAQRLGYA